MDKGLLYLVGIGTVMGAGIILSFLGAQLTTQDLLVSDVMLDQGSTWSMEAELDPQSGELGVFVVQGEGIADTGLTATVVDPSGSSIVSRIIDEDSVEERFELTTSGIHKLVLENADRELQILAVLGHMPDTTTISVGVTGFYLVIIGLIGIVGVAIYIVRNRKKR